jgi:endonuclease/exonuclease/phosphatase family metal-dependent hydrolase
VRLLTWNIQWGRGADGVVDIARTARDLRAAGDFDVICLQEVAVNFPGLPGGHAEDLVARLSETFPDYRAFYGPGADLPDGAGGRSLFGNLILSRLPVLQVFRHLLPWPSDPAVSSMQRACVEAVVETRFGPLRIMTTHLEYYSPRQRMAQVRALRGIHAEASAQAREGRSPRETDGPFKVFERGNPALLCGDFNFKPDDPEHAELSRPFGDPTLPLQDAWLAARGGPHAPTVGLHGADWPDFPYCCDFIFVSGGLLPRIARIEVERDTAASDHQPVWIELRDRG